MKNLRIKRLKTSNIRKPFLKLLPIQVAAALAGTVNALVDTVFTSRFLGEQAVAGVGFFSPMLTIIYLCYVILNGTQILCGRAVGRGKSEEVTSLFSTAAVTLAGYGVILALLGFSLRVPLSSLLGAKGEAAGYLADYFAGFMPGVPFMMLSCQTMMFLPCNNEIKVSYVVMGVMIASNTALDYLMIHVLGMGTFGLGLASSLSYLIAVLITLPRFFRKDKAYRLQMNTVRFSRIKEAVRLGAPDISFNLGVTLRTYVMNLAVMNVIGAAGVAVLSVQNSLLGFLGALPQGNAGAFTILGSIYYGEKDRTSLRRLLSLALKTGTGIAAAVSVVLVAGSSLLASLYFPSGSETNALMRQMLLFLPVLLILNTVYMVLSRIYQIQSYMKTVNTLRFLEQVFTALMAAAGIRLIGVTAVWLSNPLADVLILLIVFLWNWRFLKRAPRTVEDWAHLPADFGVPDEDVLEFEVGDMEEVVQISRTITDFCREKNVSSRKAMIAGLCVEEMAGNVIRYGLRENRKNLIEIRVVAEEQLIIRIRDNCIAFDPKQRIDQYNPEDPAKNIGIRMIARMAEEMDYHNDAGINTLLIRV